MSDVFSVFTSKLPKKRELHGHMSSEETPVTCTNFEKYHRRKFGKVGMRHYHLKRNTVDCPTINLDQL